MQVRLNTDYFDYKRSVGGDDGIYSRYEKLIYTGPIDHFFASAGLPSLE